MNPGDTRRKVSRSQPSSATLNEGRGMNPGDTTPDMPTKGETADAQRRPGHEPRRHSASSMSPVA